MNTSPRRRTGPKPTFSARDAVDVAMRLGMDRFTLGGVARELGVSTPSLYRVIESREHLAHLCLTRAVERIGFLWAPLDASQAWQDLLRSYTRAFWQALEEHPGLAQSILTVPGAHTHVQAYLRRLIDALADSEFPGGPEEILFTLDFIGDITLVTHLSLVPTRAATSTGERGLETARHLLWAQAAETDEAPVVPVEDPWAQSGWLHRKVEFIIAALETGIALNDS